MPKRTGGIGPHPKKYLRLAALLWLLTALPSAGWAQTPNAAGRTVLPDGALLTTPVGGLARTRSEARIVPVTGQDFARALRVTIGADAPDTNVTQLTMPVSVPIARGDVLMASFSLRGAGRGGGPGRVALLFERASDPYTQSVTFVASGAHEPGAWRRFAVPFTAAASYAPGEAMVSLRLAFGPQTVEVGGLSVVDYGRDRTLDALQAQAARDSPLGAVRVAVRRTEAHQTLVGLGGDFCQPRYGATTPMDAVGRYNLAHLHVAQARVGIPLNDWTPARGIYRDDAQAHAALLLMQDLSRRGIPLIGTVWEGPSWMLPGQPEQSGRTLAPDMYGDCIEAVARFLVTARDTYGVTVDEFSFNEPDYGVNFRFTPGQMAAFIRQAGPRFQALGLRTRFLIGDTTGGSPLAGFAGPLLADATLTPYLGPIAFHSWDALGSPDAPYQEVAALGHRYGKAIWCTEAGHDSALWQASPPAWGTWENGLRTAQAYAKTLRLSGAAVMDYWTYQDNYPLVDATGTRPYPVLAVVRQMEDALPRGATVVGTTVSDESLEALVTTGPGSARFSILLVAPAGGGTVMLSGLPPGAAVRVVVSDADHQGASLPSRRVDRLGHLSVPVPPRSVVTVLGGMGARSPAS